MRGSERERLRQAVDERRREQESLPSVRCELPHFDPGDGHPGLRWVRRTAKVESIRRRQGFSVLLGDERPEAWSEERRARLRAGRARRRTWPRV